MHALLVLAAYNSIAAFLLALPIALVTRLRPNPPLAHWLWVIVLLRLVAPPIVPIAGPHHLLAEWRKPTSGPAADVPAQGTGTRGHADAADGPDVLLATPVPEAMFWNRVSPDNFLWHTLLPALWLGGAAVCVCVATQRIWRFERIVRSAPPAPRHVQELTSEIAARLGIRRVPAVRTLEGAVLPLVWCAGGRPVVLLPATAPGFIDEQSLMLVLAHELSHVKRRDHWIRAAELVVAALHWWNPLAWWIRRQTHEAEELCCDAWVRWLFPGCAGRYAEVLLAVAEGCPHGRWSGAAAGFFAASPFLRSLSLKARIEMVLQGQFAPQVSRRSLYMLAVMGGFVLPFSVSLSSTESRAETPAEPPAATASKAEAPAAEQLPYVVHFQQGATHFENGDSIKILEIRGTAETFQPGHIYWIKGTYTLASCDRAMIAAYTTAKDPEHGRGDSYKVQTAMVNRGDGTFTLFLPMLYRGWPHVSLYPADGGSDLGGNYFGTGEFVLKKWWGSGQ